MALGGKLGILVWGGGGTSRLNPPGPEMVGGFLKGVYPDGGVRSRFFFFQKSDLAQKSSPRVRLGWELVHLAQKIPRNPNPGSKTLKKTKNKNLEKYFPIFFLQFTPHRDRPPSAPFRGNGRWISDGGDGKNALGHAQRVSEAVASSSEEARHQKSSTAADRSRAGGCLSGAGHLGIRSRTHLDKEPMGVYPDGGG